MLTARSRKTSALPLPLNLTFEGGVDCTPRALTPLRLSRKSSQLRHLSVKDQYVQLILLRPYQTTCLQRSTLRSFHRPTTLHLPSSLGQCSPSQRLQKPPPPSSPYLRPQPTSLLLAPRTPTPRPPHPPHLQRLRLRPRSHNPRLRQRNSRLLRHRKPSHQLQRKTPHAHLPRPPQPATATSPCRHRLITFLFPFNRPRTARPSAEYGFYIPTKLHAPVH